MGIACQNSITLDKVNFLRVFIGLRQIDPKQIGAEAFPCGYAWPPRLSDRRQVWPVPPRKNPLAIRKKAAGRLPKGDASRFSFFDCAL